MKAPFVSGYSRFIPTGHPRPSRILRAGTVYAHACAHRNASKIRGEGTRGGTTAFEAVEWVPHGRCPFSFVPQDRGERDCVAQRPKKDKVLYYKEQGVSSPNIIESKHRTSLERDVLGPATTLPHILAYCWAYLCIRAVTIVLRRLCASSTIALNQLPVPKHQEGRSLFCLGLLTTAPPGILLPYPLPWTK